MIVNCYYKKIDAILHEYTPLQHRFQVAPTNGLLILYTTFFQVDLPLSYGVTLLHQSQGYESPTNQIQFLWEPLKEVGLYVKINCISTEFTPKKHGGEKGVPFRMMIETYSHPDNIRLHAAACQVKVFKLKGADRKHKQDREKIMKKTPVEQAKLQPSYECTVFSDVPLESLESPPSTVQSTHAAMLSPLYSSDHPNADSPENYSNPGNGNTTTGSSSQATTPPACTQTGGSFSAHFSPESVRRWLIRNRFGSTKTLWDFSGLDLMRLSKEELVEMCGLAEGIRLYNALHYKITFYITVINEYKTEIGPSSESNGSMNGPGVCSTSGTTLDQDTIFHPVCLSSPSIMEFTSVLSSLFISQCPQDSQTVERLLLSVCSPGNTTRIRVLLTEQLLSTLKDQTAFKALKKGAEIFLEIVE
ncbi:Upstream-binding protein 1 [Orchesella cincta]|uniref:Upstream-binding protein 1 n=1 Tax=Orchesella cincta TaxID=48709 RepID=A0A1D2MQW9_ORCCI|nr:Upstream-binding protein 1 [Orchesella cincta]